MAMTDVNLIRYEDVDAKVRAYTHHAFLHAAGVRPYASRFHFDLARTILLQAGLTERVAVSILEAVLLLHRGLSIHEDVDTESELQRQLRVLAGDYCSSQYYWLVARVGDERLIQALSDSVVRINEAKMTVHREAKSLTAKNYIELQETIHGDLLFSLAKTYLAGERVWSTALHAAVFAYVIRRELKDVNHRRPYTLVQAMDWLNEAKDKLLQGPMSSQIEPVKEFVTDTWYTLQDVLAEQSITEGKHS